MKLNPRAGPCAGPLPTCHANSGFTALQYCCLVINLGFGEYAAYATCVTDPTVADQ